MYTTARLLSFVTLVLVSAFYLAGCTPAAKDTPKAATDGHASDHEHAPGHEHGAKDLTEKDVQLPVNFKAGVVRLKELNGKIEHLIEHNELGDVHRVAEEMAIVARKMKELARNDLPEDKQTDAGRLCNEIAGYYKPIDAAADAGKKDETGAVYQQMNMAIERLEALGG